MWRAIFLASMLFNGTVLGTIATLLMSVDGSLAAPASEMSASEAVAQYRNGNVAAMNYVSAVADGIFELQTMMDLHNAIDHSNYKLPFCAGKPPHIDRTMDILAGFIAANPNMASTKVGNALVEALIAAFPCR